MSTSSCHPDLLVEQRPQSAMQASYLTKTLFKPFWLKSLSLSNRIVMAPMTRAMSPNGVPGADVAEYYARRAKADVGLIISEGTFVPHPSAGDATGSITW